MALRRNHFADAVHGIDVLSHVATSPLYGLKDTVHNLRCIEVNDEGRASPSSIYRYADAECSWVRCTIPAIIPYCLSLCEMAPGAVFWRITLNLKFLNSYPYVA